MITGLFKNSLNFNKIKYVFLQQNVITFRYMYTSPCKLIKINHKDADDSDKKKSEF